MTALYEKSILYNKPVEYNRLANTELADMLLSFQSVRHCSQHAYKYLNNTHLYFYQIVSLESSPLNNNNIKFTHHQFT